MIHRLFGQSMPTRHRIEHQNRFSRLVVRRDIPVRQLVDLVIDMFGDVAFDAVCFGKTFDDLDGELFIRLRHIDTLQSLDKRLIGRDELTKLDIRRRRHDTHTACTGRSQKRLQRLNSGGGQFHDLMELIDEQDNLDMGILDETLDLIEKHLDTRRHLVRLDIGQHTGQIDFQIKSPWILRHRALHKRCVVRRHIGISSQKTVLLVFDHDTGLMGLLMQRIHSRDTSAERFDTTTRI